MGFTTQPTRQLKTPTKMDFRFFGQPFVQAFGVPPRCQRNQQRCQCRPNRSSHPSFGAHGPLTMDQLLEEARRKLKLNKHLEPLVTILPSWIQCSMDAIKELNNRLLPNLLRNLKKMVRNRKRKIKKNPKMKNLKQLKT